MMDAIQVRTLVSKRGLANVFIDSVGPHGSNWEDFDCKMSFASFCEAVFRIAVYLRGKSAIARVAEDAEDAPLADPDDQKHR